MTAVKQSATIPGWYTLGHTPGTNPEMYGPASQTVGIPFFGGATTGDFNYAGFLYLKEELITIASGTTTDDTVDASFLPANSLILAVNVRVTVTIPTATGFNVGDPTNTARFKTGVGVAAGSTAVCGDHWNPAGASLAVSPWNASAAKLRLSMTGGTPGTSAGRVRVQALVWTFTAPAVNL